MALVDESSCQAQDWRPSRTFGPDLLFSQRPILSSMSDDVECGYTGRRYQHPQNSAKECPAHHLCSPLGRCSASNLTVARAYALPPLFSSTSVWKSRTLIPCLSTSALACSLC